MEDDVRVTTPLIGWRSPLPSTSPYHLFSEDDPLAPSSSRWQKTTALLLLLLLPLLLVECLLPYYAVSLCAPPLLINGVQGGVEGSDTLPTGRVVDSVLLLADVHISSFCPFSDVGMRLRRMAAQRVHSTTSVVSLGDVMSFGGGADGTYNVSDLLFDFHVRRFQLIMGCTQREMRDTDLSRCVVLPGNHDLVKEPTARWLKWFPPANAAGRLPGGTSYYQLNSQQADIPSNASATLLLSHCSVTHREWGLMHSPDGPPLPVNNFRFILSGNEHVAAYHPAVVGADPFHNRSHPAEVVVPSFNVVRAMLESPKTCAGRPNCRVGVGFGVLKVYEDERMSYQLCTPVTSPYLLYVLWMTMVLLLASRLGRLLAVSAAFVVVPVAAFLVLYFPFVV